MYQSKYEGKQIDEAVSQAIDKLPVRMKEAENSIADLTKNKADAESIPTKLSQLEDDVGVLKEDDCDIAHGVKYNDGRVEVVKATDAQIDAKTNNYRPIVPANLEHAVKSVGDGYYVTQEDLKNLEFTDSIKVGDTVLTEEEVADLKTHRKEIDKTVKRTDFSAAKGVGMTSSVSSTGTIYTPAIVKATTTEIKNFAGDYKPIVPSTLEYAVGVANAKLGMASKAYVDDAIGDIETALDDINTLMDAYINEE